MFAYFFIHENLIVTAWRSIYFELENKITTYEVHRYIYHYQ